MNAIALLKEKRIILAVTGSVAAYKVADLASKLTQAGAKVDVILSESAQRFVTPLTFRSVTGRHVYHNMWGLEQHVQQVQLGEEADLMVVAPCSANTLAKLAHGMADNLVTLTALAARCPIMVAPAMDGGMFQQAAVQENLATLEQRGVHVAGPAQGRMASGLVGLGRLLETAELMGEVRLAIGRNGPLKGRHVLVTAGPTRERLDPVRFLSNRSTGKQGLALAQAALDAGATVTLVTGPVSQPIPYGVLHIEVESALQMRDAVVENLSTADYLFMAAAVADFRPKTSAEHKIKKNTLDALSIELDRNPDILETAQAWCLRHDKQLITVGFAAETTNLQAYGRAKLERKGLDFIVINDVGSENTGFGVDTNQATFVRADGTVVEIPLTSKQVVAERIVQLVIGKAAI